MKKTSKILSIVMVFALLVTSVMISTVSVQAADNVVLEWDFTDGAKDISGNGNDGIIGEGVTVADGVATFTGNKNGGIELPEGVLGDAEVVTIEVVVTPSAFSDYRTLFGIGDQVGMWVVMGTMNDGAVRYAVATDGDDASESKGNSTASSAGNAHATFQSEDVLTLNDTYTLKYVIEQDETNVYIDGELALTVPTEDKDLISSLEGPIFLGMSTKWGDDGFEGDIDSLKITIDGEAATTPDDDTATTPDDDATTTPDADDNKPSDSTSTNNSKTGDVASVASILVAGVAAMGGLKLRKKSK